MALFASRAQCFLPEKAACRRDWRTLVPPTPTPKTPPAEEALPPLEDVSSSSSSDDDSSTDDEPRPAAPPPRMRPIRRAAPAWLPRETSPCARSWRPGDRASPSKAWRPSDRDAASVRRWLTAGGAPTTGGDAGGWGDPLPAAVKAVFAALGPHHITHTDTPDFDAPAVFRPYADATWRATAAAWTRDALLARCGDLEVDYVASPHTGALETVDLRGFVDTFMPASDWPDVADEATARAFAAKAKPRPFFVQAVDGGCAAVWQSAPVPARPAGDLPFVPRATTQRVATVAGAGARVPGAVVDERYPGTPQLVLGPALSGSHLHVHGAAWNVIVHGAKRRPALRPGKRRNTW